MRIRIKNYRRFITMVTLAALVLFVLVWGLTTLVMKIFPKADPEPVVQAAVSSEKSSSAAETNPYLILVNKTTPIDKDYVPASLRVLNVDSTREIQMVDTAAAAMEKLFAAAHADNVILTAVSGYRDYATQEEVHTDEINANGEKEANEISAEAGKSEHQTGLVVDVSTAGLDYDLTTELGSTAEGKWIAAHAAEYGFIIRYPEGKESTTGFSYEPWHLRYVGVEAATEINKKDITLEQYLESLS